LESKALALDYIILEKLIITRRTKSGRRERSNIGKRGRRRSLYYSTSSMQILLSSE